jgi:hypothetical protein
LQITGLLNAFECGNRKKHNEEQNPPLNTGIYYSEAILPSPHFFPVQKTASYAHEQRKLQMGDNNPPCNHEQFSFFFTYFTSPTYFHQV